jgi:hypothetical protein
MENIIGKYHCGFRKGKSTIDQSQFMTQILEETSRVWNQHVSFVL